MGERAARILLRGPGRPWAGGAAADNQDEGACLGCFSFPGLDEAR